MLQKCLFFYQFKIITLDRLVVFWLFSLQKRSCFLKQMKVFRLLKFMLVY